MARKEMVVDFFSKLRMIDVLALLPLGTLFEGLEPRYYKLLFLLKILRVFNGFEALNQTTFMKEVKIFYNKKIDLILRNNRKLASNHTVDNNYIARIIFISYLIRSTILIMCLLCLSYFVGLLWFIICDLKLIEEDENFNDYFDVYEEYNS